MAQMIPLTCPSCGAKVRVAEDTNRFRCEYCDNEHILQISVQPAAPAAAKAIRPRVPAPESVQTIRDAESSRIVQRWFSLKYIPMAFFALVWDAFLFFWYGTVIGTGAPWIFSVFPLIHLAVGVGITYSTIAGFVNRTVVELTREELSIWFEPLPWLGEKKIKTADVKQLFCKQRFTRTKNGTRVTYQLYAVDRDDQQIKLLDGLDSPDMAKFLEQQIESWMHISDQPVVGEYAG